MKFPAITMLVSALAASFGANATTVTIGSSGILNGDYLAQGSHTGSFNGSVALAQAFQINSASFTFAFTDDADVFDISPRTVISQSSLGQRGTFLGYYNSADNYKIVRTTEVNSSQVQSKAGESVSVRLGSGNLLAGSGATTANQTTDSTSTRSAEVFDRTDRFAGGSYSCGRNRTCYSNDYVYNYYDDVLENLTTTYSDATGSFTVSGNITNAALLNDLLASRNLNFGFQVDGDLMLTDARLNLDITNLAQGVPEPGSVSLLLAMAGAWGLARRRRSQGGSARPQ